MQHCPSPPHLCLVVVDVNWPVPAHVHCIKQAAQLVPMQTTRTVCRRNTHTHTCNSRSHGQTKHQPLDQQGKTRSGVVPLMRPKRGPSSAAKAQTREGHA